PAGRCMTGGWTWRRRSEWRKPADDFRRCGDRRLRPDSARRAEKPADGRRQNDIRHLFSSGAANRVSHDLWYQAADERDAADPVRISDRPGPGMTVRIRVIPCLDVRDGRVV